MDYLQKWWEEKYPNSGVEEIANVSAGVIDIEHLIDFEQWLVKNFDSEIANEYARNKLCDNTLITKLRKTKSNAEWRRLIKEYFINKQK